MWKYAVLFSLLFAYSKGITTEGPDIVDGVKAEATDRPFQVSLRPWTGEHFCGGSIIGDYWVMTAAHCTVVYGKTEMGFLFVAAGMLDVRHPGQNNKWVDKFEHEKYDPKNSYINDISLIKVQDKWKFGPTIQAARLPKPHEPVPDGSAVVVSGWGFLGGEKNKEPHFLREVTVYVVGLDKCRKIIEVPGSEAHVHDTNICAYNSKKRAGECTDDSGGPLTLNGTQVGLVSWSWKDPYCASMDKPAQYTRVAEYIDWIKKHTSD